MATEATPDVRTTSLGDVDPAGSRHRGRRSTVAVVDGKVVVGRADGTVVDDGVYVASHGDYRGYRLASRGEERWAVDLATNRSIDRETVYAYPNHVHTTENGVAFGTGTTYPEAGRETDVLHPDEQTVFGYSPAGELRWRHSVGGFVTGIDTAGATIAAPCAQHFRTRTPETHALRIFDVGGGQQWTLDTDGIVSAAAVTPEACAAIEEPVVYHDDGEERGAYRLHVTRR